DKKRKRSRGRKYLLPVRRRCTPLHRRELRLDGSNSSARYPGPEVENAPDAGTGNWTTTNDDPSAEIWDAHACRSPHEVRFIKVKECPYFVRASAFGLRIHYLSPKSATASRRLRQRSRSRFAFQRRSRYRAIRDNSPARLYLRSDQR